MDPMDSAGPMDTTFQDSGCISGSFDHSAKFMSTPLSHVTSRKRKRHELLESHPPSPQFSSTLNESLTNNFADINLETKLAASPNNTPEKLTISPCKRVAASPLNETRRILYQDIKEVKAPKCQSPRKGGSVIRSQNKGLTTISDLLNVSCVMNVIFKYLSDNDLYRFSKVSTSFLRCLRSDPVAKDRFLTASIRNKHNKENYSISPPASPAKSPPRSWDENFQKFFKLGRSLSPDRSIRKCPTCEQPSVVEHDVSQCSHCSYIFCLRCSSFSSSGPQDFVDSCGHSVLDVPLKDASNLHQEDSIGASNSIIFSAFSAAHDSGVSSEGETSPKVKRKLFARDRKVFAHSNQVTVYEKKYTQRTTFVRVIPKQQPQDAVVECPSPPPKQIYAPCSKQSKRNLKRLTR